MCQKIWEKARLSTAIDFWTTRTSSHSLCATRTNPICCQSTCLATCGPRCCTWIASTSSLCSGTHPKWPTSPRAFDSTDRANRWVPSRRTDSISDWAVEVSICKSKRGISSFAPLNSRRISNETTLRRTPRTLESTDLQNEIELKTPFEPKYPI